ncbi:MAG: MotA/TolQ/ExbB proton channel family protein [Planctomycetota bacterium]|nr:MotA/TolQ/ExbB proton channel family protein [Planctomycetota bacterium]
MIEIIASSVNYVIASLALVCLAIAAYLYHRSRTIPKRMEETIRATAAEWNLAGASKAAFEPARVLEGMKVFVETAGRAGRAELRGYLKGADERKDLDLSAVRAVQRLARVLTEVFPLLGILGTVCALSVAVGLSGGGEPPSPDMIGQFLGLFGNAVDSTIYGLLAAVVFMVVFAAIEGRLERSYELVSRYRDVMDRALLLAYSREENGGQDNS